LRFKDCARDDVFAGNQFDLRLLTPAFAVDRRGEFRVGGTKRIREKAGVAPGRRWGR
jgi:hypothetical protein